MKKLLFTILAVLLLSFVTVSTVTAQSSTNSITKIFGADGKQKGEVIYFTTSYVRDDTTGTIDSTDNHYSSWYNIANMLKNEAESNLELTMAIIHSSDSGTSVITSTLQGRFLSGATSDPFQVDSVDATDSTETIQIYKLTLDGYKPEFIRMKFDGLTGNYDDTVISAWLMVIF